MKHWLETRQVLDRARHLTRAGKRAALATVVGLRGSAYRREGAKMLVAEDGSSVGNVSGGCLEQDVREVAAQVLTAGTSQFRSYCSGSDQIEAWDLGLGCDGQVDVFVEPLTDPRGIERDLLDGRRAFAACSAIRGPAGFLARRLVVTDTTVTGAIHPEVDARAVTAARERLASGPSGTVAIGECSVFLDVLRPPPRLFLFGAGDDAIPLARAAAETGFHVVVVDYRRGYVTADRFPGAAALVAADGSEGLGTLGLDGDSFAVVMTHNFAHDQAYVGSLLSAGVRYIGVLGPRARHDRMLQNLPPVGAKAAERLYGPVGLDLGTDGSEQVALAVVAEVLAVRSGRTPRSLRDRASPIHGDA
ncbi:MAG TPA: XdhC family protein [Gemmatimonadales bacterium]